MGQNESSALPYTIGPQVTRYQHALWTLHDGTHKETQAAVSIFVMDKKKTQHGELGIKLALNAAKRMQTLRYPAILKFLNHADMQDSLYVVTERVTPLQFHQINLANADDATRNHTTCLGLFRILSAAAWLNNDAKTVHGNIHPGSIFVTQAGERRLGGFEFAYTHGEAGSNLPYQVLQGSQRLHDASRYKSPELKQANYKHVAGAPAHVTDAWAIGCLIYETFNGDFTSVQSLAQAGKIPGALKKYYKGLLSQNVLTRRNVNTLLASAYFTQNQVVTAVTFLESLALKTPGEKNAFFSNLHRELDTFPAPLLKHTVLPSLLSALTFGGGLTAFASVLSAVLKIGNTLEEKEYAKVITPAVIQLFSSKERAVRVHLLQHLDKYAMNLTPALINNKIFPSIMSGFSDKYAPLRELSLKSLVHLVPKLRKSTVDNQVANLVMKLQADSEPRIRTNSIYCLAKIAQYLSPAARDRVLAKQLAIGLEDAFPHCRVAALVALVATLEYQTPPRIARFLMPRIAPKCVDPVANVRTQALRCITLMVEKLTQHSKVLEKAQAEETQKNIAKHMAKQQQQGGGNGASSTSDGGDNNPLAQAATAATPYAKEAASAAAKYGSWALGSITKKLGYGDEEEGGPATAATAAAGGGDVKTSSSTTKVASGSRTSKLAKKTVGGSNRSNSSKPVDNTTADDEFFDFFDKDTTPTSSSNTSSLGARLKAKKNKKKGKTGGGMRLKKEASKPVAMPATIDDDLFADLDDFGFGEPADTPPQDNTAMEADGWGDMDLDFAAEPAVVAVKPIATPLKKKPLGRKKLVKKSATKKKKPITKRPVLLSPSTKSKTLNVQKKDANTIDDWESFLQ